MSVVQNLTDVYLCVGDTVKFGFRSDAATATWTTTLNNVPFTSTDATAGAYTTVKRSTAGASQAFDVLITATAASGELTDMLYVKGSSANDPVYVYRIHVAPAREMTIGDVARNVCNSCSSRAWTASSAQPAIATVSPTSASAADGFEATITAVRNGETTLTVADAITALVNNQEVGATYTLKVKVDGPVPVNVSLARGSTVKWTDVYSKGVAGTAYALDKSAESGVSAMTEKTGDKTALTTLTAADDAVVGATVTFTVKAGDDTVTVYTVTVTDILRIPDNETLQNVASDARARWGIVQTAASASVAALAVSGVPSAGNANITLTPAHPGDATMFATNDWATGTQAYGWNVRVYSTHSTSLALNVNDQGNVTMRNFGDLTGSWSAQIGNPDAASLAFDIASAGGEAVNAAMLTVSSAKTLPLNVDELVTTVTASNAYHEESILLTVKKQARNQGSRTVVSGNNLVIGGVEVAAPWNATASPAGIVQLSAESGEAGEALTVSSIPGKSGTVEVKVRTATTVFTYTMRVVPEPYVVKFCEGDSVRIWYHNTEPKNWFLLVNDEVVQGNREWNGREVRAKVAMEGAPNRDSYLDAWAERPGAEADGDMIVVSDGENYYAYLMSCATERVIGVGQSTNMVCSTVATNIWRSSVPTEYRPFVEVRNSPDDERVHSTTATITGVAATDVAYVDVSDEVFDATEVNAQGAIYRLKVRVEGTPTISVNLTPRGYLEAPQDYRYGTAASDFKIFVNDSDTPLEGTSATANGLTFTMERVSGNLLNVRFEAAADAASTATAKFVVRDVAKVGGDNTVAVYNVAIAGPVRAIPTGTVIDGVLNPAPLQWISEVADPDVASIKPKQYGELWSVEATAKKPGDFYCQSRNPMISQGYWGSLTYVYDTHATETNLARSMTYEFDVANAGDLAGVWSASASSDLVTMTLSDGENALNSVHVTITTKAVQGATTVKISNIYHVETFNIYVGGTDKTVYRFSTPIPVTLGRTAKLPEECSALAWTAATENAAIVDLDSASGEAETDVPWEYDAYSIHATVVNGEAYIAGLLSNPVSMGEGKDVPVFYLGWGGYKLDKLIVDNNEVTLTEDNAYLYAFENLTSAHEIGIEFAPFFSGTESTPATFEYDGQAHVYEVELWDDWDPEFETEVRYSLNRNATGDEFMNKEDFIAYCTSNKLDVVNAGVHSIYYHVFAFQLGWGESIDEYGWVDTEVGGSNTVTIAKRQIGITPNPIYLSATNAPETRAELETRQDEFFKGVTAVGLIEGDTLRTEAITFTCPDYQKLVGQYRSFPDLDTKVMSMEEFVGKNYEVTFNPGVVNVIRSPMMVGGVSQAEWLDPENPTHDTGVRRVEKQYDGKPTNLVVRVDLPLDPSAYTIRYSLDDKVTWGPENPTFADVGTNRVWYAVEGTDHGWEGQSLYFAVTNYNYVIITPAPLTIKTASASKTYDGTALTADGYEVTAGALAERDTLASVTMAGSQTDVGSSVNAVAAVSITYKDEWETTWPAEQNYDITYDEGTLTVTRARVVINGVTQSGDPSNPLQWDNCGVEHVVTTYSGQPTNATVKVDRPTPEEGRIIRYTTKKPDETTDGEWLTEMPSFTDAGDHVVYYVIEDSIGNFVPVTNRTYVTIYKVVVTVQAGSDSKVFDGTPLTCPAVEITGDFVGDDRIDDLAMTSDSTITAVGSVPNKVDPDSVVWSPSDAGRNYELNRLPGTLTVVPAPTPFEDLEEDDPFDPENPHAPKSPVDEDDEITPLSLLDYVGVYDGEGHTIETNLLAMVLNPECWNGSEPSVTYSVDGTTWVTDPYVFTNVVATSFWYQVSAPNFSNYVHAAGVVITQRVATVTAASAKWTYDGEEHATNGFTTAGFVTGEGVESVTMTAASKVQNEGDVADNVIESVTYKAGTLESNYAVTLVKGTLKIADPLSFWIADHADAGAGYVNLAIKLDLVGGPELTEELARQYAADFKAVCAATEADLATAEPQSVEFVKFENGFIWVKVQIPTGDSRLLIWKIAYPKQ